MFGCWKLMFAVALCLLQGGCAGVPTSVADSARPADSSCEALQAGRGLSQSDLRITSWNVYKGARPGWQGELAGIDSPNNLLLMQEALHTKALLTELVGARQQWHFSPGYETQAGLSGVLTTAAVNAMERCTLFHNEPWLRSPKASLVTRYRLQDTNQTLLVANVHAINFTFGTRAYERQLRGVIELLREHNGPMVIAGDFNTWSKRRQRVLDLALAELGLLAVSFDAEHVKRAFGNPLDHVYYRGLALRHAEARPTDASDHSLLTARFDYPAGTW